MALLRLCLAVEAFVRAVVFLTSCHLLRVLFALIMPSPSETVLGAEEPQVSRTFYDFLASVDGTGRRGADFLLKAAGVFLNSGYEMELDLVGAGAGDIHQGCMLSLCLKVCRFAYHCGGSTAEPPNWSFFVRAIAKANANLAGALVANAGTAEQSPGSGGVILCSF